MTKLVLNPNEIKKLLTEQQIPSRELNEAILLITKLSPILKKVNDEEKHLLNKLSVIHDMVEEKGRQGYPPNNKQSIQRRDKTHILVDKIYKQLTTPLQNLRTLISNVICPCCNNDDH